MIDHFGIISPYYDRLISPRNPSQLLSYLQPPSNGSLMDIGGGTGRITVTLSPHMGHTVVTDISYKMLIQTHGKKGLDPVCAPSELLPFPDNSFDRIIMVDALHHIKEKRRTAKELWRVIKPGGRIVIEEPNIELFSVKLLALFEKVLLMGSHFIPPREISNLFAFSGKEPEINTDRGTAWIIISKPGSN